MNLRRTVRTTRGQTYGHDGVRLHPKNDGSQAAVMASGKGTCTHT